MSISAKVREARVGKLHFTQSELAAELGIQAINVSRWERGIAEPRMKHLRKLAELAGVPVAWFYAENGDVAEDAA